MADAPDTLQPAPPAVSPPGWRLNGTALVASGLILLDAAGQPGIFNCSYSLAIEGQMLMAPLLLSGASIVGAVGAGLWWYLWGTYLYRRLRGPLSPDVAQHVVTVSTVLLAFGAFMLFMGTMVGGGSPASDPLAVLFWFAVWGWPLIGARSWRWWVMPGLSLTLLLLLRANVPLRLTVAYAEPALAQLAEEARTHIREPKEPSDAKRWVLPVPRRVGPFMVYAVGISAKHGIITFQTDRGNNAGLALVTERITVEKLMEDRLVQFTARGINLNYQNIMPLGSSWYGYSWYQD